MIDDHALLVWIWHSAEHSRHTAPDVRILSPTRHVPLNFTHFNNSYSSHSAIGQPRRATMDHLSQRGRSNIVEIMSKVPKSLLEDSKSKSSETDRIDLSVAENWLIRNEVLEICKSVINQRFQTHVSHFCATAGTAYLIL